MDVHQRRILVPLLVFALFLGLNGCATVPKEVVQLSYTVGQDIDAIHSSYRMLIQKHFDDLRAQTTTFLETRWMPTYLADWIKNGELVPMAQNPEPAKAFEGVSAWVEVAIEDIEKEKKELLTPINKDEKALLAYVDDAFARLIRANATITAHLNSIRKVQEVQDEALQALKIKDLRDQINQRLVDASEKAAAALPKIEGAKLMIKQLDEKKNELLKKQKGESKQ